MPHIRRKYRSENAGDLDNVIFLRLDPLREKDLPQIANEEELIAAALHDISGKPCDLISAEMHHQVDGSYQ